MTVGGAEIEVSVHEIFRAGADSEDVVGPGDALEGIVFVTGVGAEQQVAQEFMVLWGAACPFNGVLIHRQVIQSIGLPLSGMFLWGDESEYFLRARPAGYQMATVGAARFHHSARPHGRALFQVFQAEFYVMYATIHCAIISPYVIVRSFSAGITDFSQRSSMCVSTSVSRQAAWVARNRVGTRHSARGGQGSAATGAVTSVICNA
jgi:hypothetical protein